MSDISPSIWNQDNNGEWKLYFNTDSDISSPSQKNKEEQKIKKSLNTSDKNLVLGTLVMTPEGIGRLIKSADGIAHIRFNQEIKEHQFKINEISSTFNCYISFINNGIPSIWYVKSFSVSFEALSPSLALFSFKRVLITVLFPTCVLPITKVLIGNNSLSGSLYNLIVWPSNCNVSPNS